MNIQKFTLTKLDEAVLQAKFQTPDNEIKFIHEGENAVWTSSAPSVVKIVDSKFDGTNYNVTISCLNTGVATLTAAGNFLSNDKASENDYFGFELSGKCEIEVRPTLPNTVFFTLTHKTGGKVS